MIRIKTILLIGLMALISGCSQEQSPKVIGKEQKLIDEKITLLRNVHPVIYDSMCVELSGSRPFIEAVDIEGLNYFPRNDAQKNSTGMQVSPSESNGRGFINSRTMGKIKNSDNYLIKVTANGGGSLTWDNLLEVKLSKRFYSHRGYEISRLYVEHARKNKQFDDNGDISQVHSLAIFLLVNSYFHNIGEINEINYLTINEWYKIADYKHKKNKEWFELYNSKSEKPLICKYKVDSFKKGILNLTVKVLTLPHDNWTTKKAQFQFFKTDEKNVKTIRGLGWKLVQDK